MDNKYNFPQDPFESLENLIIFSQRDWSENEEDAWIYGIVAGWDLAINDICNKFNWNNKDKQRLIMLHEKFQKLKNKIIRKNNNVTTNRF